MKTPIETIKELVKQLEKQILLQPRNLEREQKIAERIVHALAYL